MESIFWTLLAFLVVGLILSPLLIFLWGNSPFWPKHHDPDQGREQPLFCPFDGRALTPAKFVSFMEEQRVTGYRMDVVQVEITRSGMCCWRWPRFWRWWSEIYGSPVHTHFVWMSPRTTRDINPRRYDPKTGLPL